MIAMNNNERCMQLGHAGVLRVASELLLRGIPVWLPTVDYGCDLMTQTGQKVQVKTSSLTPGPSQQPLYSFRIGDGRERDVKDTPDIYVLVGWDEKRFWTIPASEVIGQTQVTLVSNLERAAQGAIRKWESQWEIFSIPKVPPQKIILDGTAGELRVQSELYGMGIEALKCYNGSHTDLFTVAGARIQVKVARISSRRNESPTFNFHLNPARAHNNAMSRKVKYSESFDLFVLWGIDQNRFWVVPAAELDYVDNFIVGNEARWVDPEPVRALRAEGKSYNAIGKELGIGTVTAWKKVNLEQNGREAETARLKAFEDRWDLITSHASLMAQAVEAPLNVE